jgi:hypothetical protein
VVHEALFSQWDRLRDWIEENRDLLRIRGRVETAAARWNAEGRPRDLLLPDGRLLAEAEDLLRHLDVLSLSGPVESFVEQSAVARRRRRRWRLAAVTAVAAGLAVATAVSWYQWQAWQRNRIEAKLFEYREALRDAEKEFLAHGPAPVGIKKALDAAQRVVRLIEEVKTLQGSAPEGADEAAAKAYEFSAVLRIELGDPEGSLRELEARKALSEKLGGLREVLSRNPAMMSYAMVVFDLNLELTVANMHLKVLLQQNEVLKQALEERMAKESGSPVPLQPPAKTETPKQDPRDVAREILRTNRSYVRLLEYMTQRYGREQDYIWLMAFQKYTAQGHETLQEWDEAHRVWGDRVVTARKRLDWARNNSMAYAEDKKKYERNAAKEVVVSQEDLVSFYMRRKEWEQALAEARDELKTLETEPELKYFEGDRFAVRRRIATLLANLGQTDAALQEVETGAAAILAWSQEELGASWKQLAQRYKQVASARADVGNIPGAVEAARHAVMLLEHQAQSPAGAADASAQARAYLELSWHLIFAKRFAEAEGIARKGLTLPVSEEEMALLNTNLAHALLFHDLVDQAREVYEAWKDKPVGKDKIFAASILEDFDALENAGLKHAAMPNIRTSMRAAVEAQQKAASKPQPN